MAPHPLGSPLLSTGGVHKCRNKQMSHKARHSNSATSLDISPDSSLSSSPALSFSGDPADTGIVRGGDETGVTVPGGRAPSPAYTEINTSVAKSPEVFVINPENRISRSNRRSSSLSQCMMKERISYRPMGRDSEGYLIYSLHVEESQGFKWNRNLSRLNRNQLGFDHHISLLGSALYDFSSEEDSDSDDYSMHETIFIPEERS